MVAEVARSSPAPPGRPTTVIRLGHTSWALLGIIALTVVVAAGLGAISGILVPLVIAVVLGTLLEPVARGLRRMRVSAELAATLSLLLVILVALAATAIVVVGFVRQLPEITRQLMLGWTNFIEWGRGMDLDPVILERIRQAAYGVAPQIGQGALGVVSNTMFGAISIVLGAFFAFFFLFFVIKDHDLFPRWVARLTGVDSELAVEIDGIAQKSIREYFRGIALSALITAPIFMIPLLLLRIPLAIPIFILYFLFSFIPYVGAWLTAAFVILIAFGSGGPTAALIMAVTIGISNGTVQNVVNSWILGASLKMHPIAVLLATMVGGTVAGLLGMVLGPPLLAASKSTMETIRAHRDGTALVEPIPDEA